MFTITANKVTPQTALVDIDQLRLLVKKAQTQDDVQLIEVEDDLPIEALMKFSENNAALSFLDDERENVYTVNDVKVRYK